MKGRDYIKYLIKDLNLNYLCNVFICSPRRIICQDAEDQASKITLTLWDEDANEDVDDILGKEVIIRKGRVKYYSGFYNELQVSIPFHGLQVIE